jgi:hypothetical protein
MQREQASQGEQLVKEYHYANAVPTKIVRRTGCERTDKARL